MTPFKFRSRLIAICAAVRRGARQHVPRKKNGVRGAREEKSPLSERGLSGELAAQPLQRETRRIAARRKYLAGARPHARSHRPTFACYTGTYETS